MTNSSRERTRELASGSEKADLDRLIMIWANQFPDIPDSVPIIKYEYFAAKTVGMALSSIQGAAITKRYICGGYMAEYDFEMRYQIAPTDTSDDKRLQAVELLNSFADWARQNWPDIGARQVVSLRPTSFASFIGQTEDRYEVYALPMKLTYEVI